MNWKKLIEDHKKGKLDNVIIFIDNDDGFYSLKEPADDDVAMLESLEETYGLPGGYQDVVDILQAIGLEADWV